MAWTYTTLKQALQDVLETDETTFVTNIPVLVQQAENRLIQDLELPNFRKVDTGTLTASNQYLTVPTDFLAPFALAIDNSGYEYLLLKDVSFIREMYPDATVEAAPRYFALYSDTQFILAATPDANYSYELHYFYSPESIVTAGSSWLGTHAEAALLSACLVECYIFLKGDPDMMAVYKEQMDRAVGQLKDLANRRNKIQTYRNP